MIRLPVGLDRRGAPFAAAADPVLPLRLDDRDDQHGDTRTIGAGDAWLMGDTTGKGHRTEVVEGPVDAVIVQLPAAG